MFGSESSTKGQASPHRARQVAQHRKNETERSRHPHHSTLGSQSLDGRLGDLLGCCREGRGFQPGCHARRDKARSHDQNVDAIFGHGVAETLGKPVDTGLRSAVHRVGAANSLAGDTAEHDDRAVALLSHLIGDGDRARHNASEVHLSKFGCEAAPFVLGFILGSLMEENLRRSMQLSGGDALVFFQRPISLILLVFAAGIVLLVVLPQFRKTREKAFQE